MVFVVWSSFFDVDSTQGAADLDSDVEENYAYRNQLRGQKTMKLLTADDALRTMGLSAILSKPLDDYRKLIDWANKQTGEAERSQSVYVEHDTEERMVRAIGAAANANIRFLSGQQGMEAVKQYVHSMVHLFESDDCDLFGIGFTEQSLTAATFSLACGAAETWRRLWFPFQSYPWLLITKFMSDPTKLQDILDEARLRSEHCDACVDKHFCEVLLNASEDGISLVSISEFLMDIIATIRISSINVECQHTYYQHVAKTNGTKRGRLPATIQSSTFQASLQVAHSRIKRDVSSRYVVSSVEAVL